MNVPRRESPQFKCECGNIRGHISGSGTFNRVVCYCIDCQVFARHLGCAGTVLNKQGGTQIIQLAQPRLKFDHGIDNLTAVKLSEKGLIRWYASCCNTPFGNTVGSAKFSFIGLIHSVLGDAEIERFFQQELAVVNPAGAYCDQKPKATYLGRSMWRILKIAAGNRITGNYKRSPLFNDQHCLIVSPSVLSTEQVNKLKETY